MIEQPQVQGRAFNGMAPIEGGQMIRVRQRAQPHGVRLLTR